MRGLEAHDGAEIVERRIDVLALRHAGEHLGRAVAHTLRVDLDQRAGVALDRVARMDVERAVVGHDLPVGAARQNAAVEPRAGDGSAEQVHHAAMAERRGPEVEVVGDFTVHVTNRRARDDIHAFSHAPMRLADVVSSGRVEYESGPTKKSRWEPTCREAWSASRLPERYFSARSPSTASTISSPIRARIFRRSSRRSAARAAATPRCRALCWCRTRISRWRWRTVPTSSPDVRRP